MSSIEKAFNKKISVTKSFARDITLVEFTDREKIVVKNGKNFRLEGEMLRFLGEYLPCVQVLELNDEFLAMEYIQSSSGYDEGEVGTLLATLHKNRFEFFGFENDTTIGSFIQPNPKSESWIEFYKNARILYTAKKCLDEGSLESVLFDKVVKLTQKFDSLLTPPPYPSLLHGDIWSGNVMSKNAQPIFIDPAIYYGHYECELGFLKMFSTFGNRFYDAYKEIIPLERDFFDSREDLYMLYWILVHVRAFGGSYVYDMESIVRRYV